MTQRYDKEKETLWILSTLDPDSLFPADELRHLSSQVRDGKLADGRTVKEVNVVFTDADTAEYNESALGFSKIGVYVGTLEDPTVYASALEFKTRDDFGV
jgi:hypothetical protein